MVERFRPASPNSNGSDKNRLGCEMRSLASAIVTLPSSADRNCIIVHCVLQFECMSIGYKLFRCSSSVEETISQ